MRGNSLYLRGIIIVVLKSRLSYGSKINNKNNKYSVVYLNWSEMSIILITLGRNSNRL